MSCSCCPPIIFGSGGGTPPPPCVSPGSETVLTVDESGCLGLVTDPTGPVRPGPGGLTVCLSQAAGQIASLDEEGCLLVPEPVPPTPLTVDPAECNAAQITDDVLLVPRTDVAGVVGSAPAATGTSRSVDIDVVETSGCPTLWTVGARLTPVSGFKNVERGYADLLAQEGTVVPIPESDIVLPEPGVYHIDTDVRFELACNLDAGADGYIVANLNDETTGTLLTSFTEVVAMQALGRRDHKGGTTHLMTEYVVTTAPRTIRLHLALYQRNGAMTRAAAGGSDSNGATRMRFLKVRD